MPRFMPSLLSGAAGAALAFALLPGLRGEDAPGPALPGVAHAQAEPRSDTGWPDVAERAVRSVVNIASTKTMRFDRGPMADPFFQYFFFGPQRPPPVERSGSLGSGVVVSADGLVLTNNHVVEGADDIKVTLTDGREFDAKVVGTDPKTDVAVIRLQGKPERLEAMPLGSSDSLRLGETVLAIGNPFGLGHTVTMGIVSAKGRANVGITDYEDFIQTDAAINPGNSGGALVNARGELVGINTAIASRTGGYQGIGFAIPSTMAESIMNSLVKDGHVSRGWLGVGIQDLDDRLARHLGVAEGTHGVLVTSVVDDTPAAEAGLKSGDVIVDMDGTATASAGHLRNAIALRGADQKVKLGVLRDGQQRTIDVRLGALPEDQDAVAVRDRGDQDSAKDAPLGLQLRPLDTSARRRLGLAVGVRGVLVSGVDPGSPAARVGLRPGDVIVEVDRQPVETIDTVTHALRKGKGEALLLVKRGRGSMFVVVPRS
ncbi:MAG: DegQ family serine endoprotease [Myxococcales bacterium]|nr:DegQ family serine endoprotease [Myxococcales bacterium]